MIYIFSFILGLLVGSFLNVCIYRIPEGLSIVSPGSRCGHCGVPVKFYDNIPLVSYVLLRGRCRHCATGYSPRYFLIELLTGLLYTLVVYRFIFESPLVLLIYLVFVSALIVIFFIDIDHQIIPNSITLPGIPMAILAGSFVLPDPFNLAESLTWQNSVGGFLAGGGFFYTVAVVGRMILKKDAMGGGDIKMMAMVGGLLGWQGVIFTTFIGSLLGSIFGVGIMIIKGREWSARIPFGPYLAMGSLISLLWGGRIWEWYKALWMFPGA
ncbi:MAG: prepilin peptidase [Nitrospira sp.]|nr:prepilin peptidase [bacterium]MBL7049139.1 prepilin peptidase [Nitrospira sp.]